MNKLPISFITVLISLFSLPLLAQEIQKVDQKQKTIALYDSIRSNIPREKIYVHFDKNSYLTSDTIWFKAYLTDASLNTAPTLSGLIYTELINENGSVVKSMSLPTIYGLGWGGFAGNADQFKPGNYTFRAYTNWMQNFGESCFFKKEIKILPIINLQATNSKEKPSSPKPKKADSTLKERIRDFDVQFLPEGGNWLAGISQKMAFKAINGNGKGILVMGEIVDSKLNKVAHFSANGKGMGYFNLSPNSDESYTAQVNYNGLTKNIKLPKAKVEGTILKVKNDYGTDSICITVLSEGAQQECILKGQSRGFLCFIANIKFNESKSKTLKIAKSAFPSGVCQIILLDDKNRALNERNFFINHGNNLNIKINSEKFTYGIRDSIPIHVNVLNPDTKPVISSLSIAVTADDQVAKDTINDSHILSYLLLTSDLKGEVENPGYYFNQPSQQQHEDLDALLLTQAWVSYDWDLTKKPTFKAEKEFVVKGRVSNFLNKPVAKAKLTMIGTNKTFMMMDTVSNDKGEFTFKNLPLLDSASFVIQAKNQKGKNGTLGIELDNFTPPPVPISSQTNRIIEEQQLDTTSKNLINTKAEEYRLTFREGLLLNEVKIVGKRGIKNSKNLNGIGGADQLITDADLARIKKKSLLDVLEEKVKGFRVGFMKKSNARNFYINSALLKLVIDGIEVDFGYPGDSSPDSYYNYIKFYLDYYTAEDILGIEVMANLRYSSSYRSKFMGPMDNTEYAFLEITTKTGAGPFLKKAANMYLYRPMNYADNKVFYSPKYTSANKSNKKPDFRSTIYWNPNLVTDEKGNAQTSFFSADKKGSYTIWIEGTDMQGNLGMKVMKLIIK